MNFRQLYDVSVNLTPELAGWPGDDTFRLEKTGEIANGEVSNVTRLLMSTHNGTHMDAPRHFIDGEIGIDEVPLDALVGTAYVVDMTHMATHIGAADLEKAGLPEKPERILFKTTNSQLWTSSSHEFRRDYIALAPDGAEWLVQHGIKLVGIDYLSIEEFEPPRHNTHYTLLGKHVVVVEGVDLREVEPGEYTIFALPLKIKNGDGAPARVLLGRN
ncbi:MAG TPA: cyclase family protein [Chloroflexia bacterium]|nr:cyclase family protein [Chloroflexia bacterium]